jgi:hypothetical protein
MNEQEIWRDVVGYEGFYQVSNLGRVMSCARQVRGRVPGSVQWRPSKVLSCYIDKTSTGYRCANLSMFGSAKKCSVHILVLEAFVGPRPSPDHEACHNNGIRSDARLSNLRWDTRAANKEDMRAHGTAPLGEKSSRAVLTAEFVAWIRESRQSSLSLAPVLGVSSSAIRAVRIGQNWSHQA